MPSILLVSSSSACMPWSTCTSGLAPCFCRIANSRSRWVSVSSRCLKSASFRDGCDTSRARGPGGGHGRKGGGGGACAAHCLPFIPRLLKGPHHHAEPVIGPATSGRTHWHGPPPPLREQGNRMWR